MGSLINELTKSPTVATAEPELQYDQGDPYYNRLPARARQATLQDFTDHNGQYQTGIAYLIHSQRQSDRYWAKRSKPGFTEHNDFFIFMELGRIYVFE
jgi:hypothetical protein